jgi:hypothetical protein
LSDLRRTVEGALFIMNLPPYKREKLERAVQSIAAVDQLWVDFAPASSLEDFVFSDHVYMSYSSSSSPSLKVSTSSSARSGTTSSWNPWKKILVSRVIEKRKFVGLTLGMWIQPLSRTV